MSVLIAKIILLFHFWPYPFYFDHTIFEGFLEKVFVSIKKSILPLYDMHIIVLIASEIRENCRSLDNSALNLFRKVKSESPKFYNSVTIIRSIIVNTVESCKTRGAKIIQISLYFLIVAFLSS